MMIAVAAIVAGLLIEIIRNPPTATPLESLATFVNAHGTPWSMPQAMASFFGVAGKNIDFAHFSVSAGEETRTIGVRRRIDFSRTDILLLDHLSSGDTACYFTSPDGKLLMSCYIDAQIQTRTIDDAEERFKHELDFWLAWQRDQTQHGAK